MDKKLTDAEIIKGLEDTLHRIKGAEHLIVPKLGFENLCNDLENALDLINRLQAENEVLESRIGVYETCNARKDEAIRGLETENERLKENNLTLEKCCDNCIYEEKTLQAQPCCECFSYRNFTPKDFLKLIKAEAYKEFYEKLHTEILAARDSNFKAKEERIAKSKEYGIPIDIEDNFLMYCDGKIHALDGIDYFAYETYKELVGDNNESKN